MICAETCLPMTSHSSAVIHSPHLVISRKCKSFFLFFLYLPIKQRHKSVNRVSYTGGQDRKAAGAALNTTKHTSHNQFLNRSTK